VDEVGVELETAGEEEEEEDVFAPQDANRTRERTVAKIDLDFFIVFFLLSQQSLHLKKDQ
jgi:hypothetical protein